MSDPFQVAALQDTTRAMSTAIAPVFLVTGAATLLTVMAQRYSRVIDRARVVLATYRSHPDNVAGRDLAEKELRSLYRRARLLRTTILLNAISIFCVAATIFVIFANMTLAFALPYVVPGLFTLALLLLLTSLALMIEDFAISLGGLKFEIRTTMKRDIFRGHRVDEPLE